MSVKRGYKQTDVGVIPEEWEVASLGTLVHSIQYGSAAASKPKGKVPVLRMGNLQGGGLDWRDLVCTDDPAEIRKYELRSGDVLFNRTNTVELVGKTSIYKGERQAIFAVVSFFGVYELYVELGTSTFEESSTIVFDVDVNAQTRPRDVQIQRRLGVALGEPRTTFTDPSSAVSQRLRRFHCACESSTRDIENMEVVDALNAVRELPQSERYGRVMDVLAWIQQRLLNLVQRIARGLAQLADESPNKEGQELKDYLLQLVRADGARDTGLSDCTMALVESLRTAMAGAFLKLLEERPIGVGDLTELFEGASGRSITCRTVIEAAGKLHEMATGKNAFLDDESIRTRLV